MDGIGSIRAIRDLKMNWKEQEDDRLLQALLQDDCKAFDELYMRYAPHVEAFAFCLLKNRTEAEDLAHDIFLKIWENHQSLGHVRSLRNYLFTMTKNAVFDLFEHKNVRLRYERFHPSVGELVSEDLSSRIASEDLLLIIEMAVEQMPEQRRRVFRMSRYEKRSYQEIASELGISTKTVEYHIRTALAELKKIIGILAFFC